MKALRSLGLAALAAFVTAALVASCATHFALKKPQPLPVGFEIVESILPPGATVDSLYATALLDTTASGAIVGVPVFVLVSGENRLYILNTDVPRTEPDSTTDRPDYTILWYRGVPVVDLKEKAPPP